MIWPLLHVLGITKGSNAWPSFWEGFGSGPIAWCLLPIAYFRQHNCNEPRCIRLGVHPVDGTPFKACRKHHPALPPKAAPGHIAEAYRRAHGNRKANEA